MGVNSNILLWTASFLTNRPQYTMIDKRKSDTIHTNTGAPQGCKLSPLFFSLYTNEYKSQSSNCTLLKYADDKVFIGKIVNDDDSSYVEQVNDFVEWCKNNHLILNVKNT